MSYSFGLSALPLYFYNPGKKYHSILTLEKGGTTVKHRSIFITLALGIILRLRVQSLTLVAGEITWTKIQKDSNPK
jgi:hypothetical protein